MFLSSKIANRKSLTFVECPTGIATISIAELALFRKEQRMKI